MRKLKTEKSQVSKLYGFLRSLVSAVCWNARDPTRIGTQIPQANDFITTNSINWSPWNFAHKGVNKVSASFPTSVISFVQLGQTFSRVICRTDELSVVGANWTSRYEGDSRKLKYINPIDTAFPRRTYENRVSCGARVKLIDYPSAAGGPPPARNRGYQISRYTCYVSQGARAHA